MNWYNRQLVTAAIDDLRSVVTQVGQVGKQIIDTLIRSKRDPKFSKNWANQAVAGALNTFGKLAKDAIRFLQIRNIPAAAGSIERAYDILKKLCGSKCTMIPTMNTIKSAFDRAYALVDQVANHLIEQPQAAPQRPTQAPRANPKPISLPPQMAVPA